MSAINHGLDFLDCKYSQTAYIPLPSTSASHPGRVDASYGLRTLGSDPIAHLTVSVISDMNVDAVNPSCHCLTPSATRAECPRICKRPATCGTH
jgi:hypothetical protein